MVIIRQCTRYDIDLSSSLHLRSHSNRAFLVPWSDVCSKYTNTNIYIDVHSRTRERNTVHTYLISCFWSSPQIRTILPSHSVPAQQLSIEITATTLSRHGTEGREHREGTRSHRDRATVPVVRRRAGKRL
jgi:hypothetical protein